MDRLFPKETEEDVEEAKRLALGIDPSAYKDLKKGANKEERKAAKASLKEYLVWKNELKKQLIRDIGMCEKCHRRDLELTIDHIIPVVILVAMDVNPDRIDNEIGNFRLLCKLCNVKKGHHLDFTDPRTKPLLLHYLKFVPNAESFGVGHPFNDRSQSFKDYWKEHWEDRLSRARKAP